MACHSFLSHCSLGRLTAVASRRRQLALTSSSRGRNGENRDGFVSGRTLPTISTSERTSAALLRGEAFPVAAARQTKHVFPSARNYVMKLCFPHGFRRKIHPSIEPGRSGASRTPRKRAFAHLARGRKQHVFVSSRPRFRVSHCQVSRSSRL